MILPVLYLNRSHQSTTAHQSLSYIGSGLVNLVMNCKHGGRMYDIIESREYFGYDRVKCRCLSDNVKLAKS